MPNYYVDIDQELADRLQQIESEAIVEALEELADSKEEQPEGDELSKYQSLSELRADDSISAAERKGESSTGKGASAVEHVTKHSSH